MSATSLHIFLPSFLSIFPYFFIRRPRLCLDMVSSGGLSRLPRSRHLGTFGTILGSLPECRLYLSIDAPQTRTVLSSLPLASDLVSGLHATEVTLRFRCDESVQEATQSKGKPTKKEKKEKKSHRSECPLSGDKKKFLKKNWNRIEKKSYPPECPLTGHVGLAFWKAPEG